MPRRREAFMSAEEASVAQVSFMVWVVPRRLNVMSEGE